MNKFGPQSKNLASIVRGFKSSVTKYAHLIHADFQWQSRYYDHIIRDAESFERILNTLPTILYIGKKTNSITQEPSKVIILKGEEAGPMSLITPVPSLSGGGCTCNEIKVRKKIG